MNITEILITGYDGDTGVFAMTSTRERSRTILTTEDADGQSRVDSVLDLDLATTTFDDLLNLLTELGVTSCQPAAAGSR